MSITLTSEQEQFVQEMIATGRFQKPEEVIQAAFDLLEEHSVQYQQWVNEIREKVDVGLQELNRGEGIELEVVMHQLRGKIQQAREQGK
jgi:antitoxin ParD1/3/4